MLSIRALLFLLLLGVAPLWAVGRAPWMDGETLNYEISWGFVTAGNASMVVKPLGGTPARTEFISHAWNNGFFETVYPVKDTVYTRVLDEGWLPEVFRKVLNEGSYFQKSQIRFDRAVKKAFLSDTLFKEPVKRVVKRSSDTSLAITGQEHCITSAFYLMRTMDLKPGKTSHFQALSGKRKYDLKVICHRRERIETALGKKDCLVVEPVLDGDGIFNAKGRLTIWLTDDAKRIPVLLKTEIALGSVKAELTGLKE
jgi:hypothetical protein